MNKESNRETIDIIRDIIQGANSQQDLYDKIVNAPFVFKLETAQLFLGIIVLLLENQETKTIDRIALSKTELANYTTSISKVPFKDIKIPIDYPNNIIVKAIKLGKYQMTTDWSQLFNPSLTEDQARLNQAGGGIACSFVYPLIGPIKKGR